MQYDPKKQKLYETLLLIGVVLSCILVCLLFNWKNTRELNSERQKWNNGYCSCGGKWEYSNTSNSRGVISYHFKCKECNDIATFYRKVFVEQKRK